MRGKGRIVYIKDKSHTEFGMEEWEEVGVCTIYMYLAPLISDVVGE